MDVHEYGTDMYMISLEDCMIEFCDNEQFHIEWIKYGWTCICDVDGHG